MKRTCVFKSILMVPDPSGEKGNISYDMESVKDHSMELTPSAFLLCRSWITSFLLAMMAVLIVFTLLYGLLVIGMKVDMGEGSAALTLFALAAALSFVVLFLALGLPAAVKRLKMDFTLRERGKGRWKLINKDDWAMFLKMRTIENERRKREEEFRSVR